MNVRIPTGVGLLLIVGATVVLLVLTREYRQIPRTTQAQNLAHVEHLAPEIRSLLAKDPRFKDITIYPYTGQGGAIGVTGRVKKDNDLFDLMKLLAREQYDLPLHWGVQVVEGME